MSPATHPNPVPTLVTDQVRYAESPRWHDGKLWFSDVHDFALKRVSRDGQVERLCDVPGRPAGLGFMPDGRLLLATALDKKLWWWTESSGLSLAYDLSERTLGLLNDMVVDGFGRAYVGDTGFNLMAGEQARPGQIFLFDGTDAIVAAEDVMFPNGAAVSADGARLTLSETSGHRVSTFRIKDDGTLSGRETLADLGDMTDGLCIDADGGTWVAMLRLGLFLRLDATGRQVAQISAEGRLAVACVIGGDDGRQLFLCSAATTMQDLGRGISTGLIHRLTVESTGQGWP